VPRYPARRQYTMNAPRLSPLPARLELESEVAALFPAMQGVRVVHLADHVAEEVHSRADARAHHRDPVGGAAVIAQIGGLVTRPRHSHIDEGSDLGRQKWKVDQSELLVAQ